MIFGVSLLFVFLILAALVRKLDFALQRPSQYADCRFWRLPGALCSGSSKTTFIFRSVWSC